MSNTQLQRMLTDLQRSMRERRPSPPATTPITPPTVGTRPVRDIMLDDLEKRLKTAHRALTVRERPEARGAVSHEPAWHAEGRQWAAAGLPNAELASTTSERRALLQQGVEGQLVSKYLDAGPSGVARAVRDLGQGGGWNAGADLLQSAGISLLPAVAPVVAMGGVPAAALAGGIGTGTAGYYGAPAVAKALGASEGFQRFSGELGGFLDPTHVGMMGMAIGSLRKVGTKAALDAAERLAAKAARASSASASPLVSEAAPERAAPRSMRLRPEDRVALQPAANAPPGVQPVNAERATDALSRRLMQERMPGAYAPKNPVTALPPWQEGLPPFTVGRLSPEDWIANRLAVMSPADIAESRQWYTQLKQGFVEAFGPQDADKKLMAWAVSQQQASPAKGMLDVLRVEQEQLGRPAIWWRNQPDEVKKAARRLENADTAKKYQEELARVPAALRELFPKERPQGKFRSIFDEVQEPKLGRTSGGLAEDKIRTMLSGRDIEGGIGKKLSDFGDNVTQGKSVRTYMGNDPRGGHPTAVDVWAGRDRGFIDTVLYKQIRERYGDDVAKKLAQDFNAIDDNRYEEALNFYQQVTDRLNTVGTHGTGWVPSETQAVGWGAIQKLQGVRPQTPEDIFKQNTRRVAFELSYGSNSPFSRDFPGLSALPYQTSKQITEDVTKKTVDALAKASGVRNIKVFYGPGGYEHYPVQPSGQVDVLAPPERVQDFIDALGYTLNQTEVIASRPMASGSRPGFQVTFDVPESQLDAVLPVFWEKLRARAPQAFGGSGAGFSPAVQDGHVAMRIFRPSNPRAWSDLPGMTTAIHDVATQMGLTINPSPQKTGLFKADMLTSKNDWSTHAQGEVFLASLDARGRTDLSRALVSDFGPQVRRWVEDAFGRYAPEALAAHRAGGANSPASTGEALASLAALVAKAGLGKGNPSLPKLP